MRNIIITGGCGGLGQALLEALNEGDKITAWDIQYDVDVSRPGSIYKKVIKLDDDHVDILINCAGINDLSYFEDLEVDAYDKIMAVNARSLWLVTQALGKRLDHGTVCNIISNAAHVPMTASLAYNASKAAAEMITRQMAHELGPKMNLTVFGVSPNKMAGTAMSQKIDRQAATLRNWSPEESKYYQLSKLPIHAETPVKIVAEFIAFLLSSKDRHKYLHGCIIPYGGPQ